MEVLEHHDHGPPPGQAREERDHARPDLCRPGQASAAAFACELRLQTPQRERPTVLPPRLGLLRVLRVTVQPQRQPQAGHGLIDLRRLAALSDDVAQSLLDL